MNLNIGLSFLSKKGDFMIPKIVITFKKKPFKFKDLFKRELMYFFLFNSNYLISKSNFDN